LKALVAYAADDESVIVVEVDESEVDEGTPGFERAGLGGAGKKLVKDAGERFDAALDTIRPIATTVVEKVRQLAESPEEVSVEFGLNLNVKAGVAVLASSQAEAHLQVTLTWKQQSSTAASSESTARPAAS
jgi:hypothetical protein